MSGRAGMLQITRDDNNILDNSPEFLLDALKVAHKNKFTAEDFHEFKTPKVSKIPVKPISRRENQTNGFTINIPDDTDLDMEFVTPRVSHIKPKSLLREAFPVKPLCGVDGQTTSSRADGVPTAHVTPSLSRTEERRRQSNTGIHGDPRDTDHGKAQNGHISSTATRRWNSSGNLNRSSGEEFHELAHDPNPTLDASAFYHEAEDIDLYRHRDNPYCQEDERFAEPHPARVDTKRRASAEVGVKGYSLEGTHSSGIGASELHASNPDMYYSYGNQDLYGSRKEAYYRATYPARTVDRVGYGHPLPAYPHPQHSTGYTPYRADYDPYTPPAPPPRGADYTNDLTHWQRHHQDQLLRQQYEATQPMIRTMPGSSYTAHHSSLSNTLLGDPHRLDAIKKAADNIIKEKDQIIDKQKVKILELERHTKHSEVEKHKELLQKAKDGEHSMNLHIQELQYENASVKAQMAELVSNRKFDNTDLEKKLGATEYEMRELKLSLEKELLSKSTELKKLHTKLDEREHSVCDWQARYGELEKANDSLQKQVDSMQRYFEDLPTVDEHSKKASEIKHLKEDKSKYKHRCADLERKLSDVQKGLQSRETLIESLEVVESDLKVRIETLEKENSRLRERLTKDGLSKMDEEIEELRYENKKLKSDVEKAKKLLEGKHKKLQSVEAKHREEAGQYEERLTEEQTSVTKLREEVHTKDHHLKKLRHSVKELGAQNQDLMEKNLGLSDRVKELERHHTGEAGKLERRLLAEMGIAFSELQALIQICVQRAEGQEVNMSVLLGVKSSPLADDEALSSDNVQSLKTKLSKLRELRQEIDQLRELISNKYAEDMGENLNCTTQ